MSANTTVKISKKLNINKNRNVYMCQTTEVESSRLG